MMHAFHPEAAQEFTESVQYYQDRGRLLGERFASEVRTTIEKIINSPKRWRILEDDVRICHIQVFPFNILYTIESDEILIVAVMHARRQPGYWKSRLK